MKAKIFSATLLGFFRRKAVGEKAEMKTRDSSQTKQKTKLRTKNALSTNYSEEEYN